MQKQRRGQLGINVVERIVIDFWNCRWQPIDGFNDDGIDGLILLESRGVPTGQIVLVQVKCIMKQANLAGYIAIPIKKEKMQMNFERWRRVVGAAILIHVDPKNFSAHWVDLQNPAALGNTQVFVPSAQEFNKSSKKTIANLCGTIHRDFLVKKISTETEDFQHVLSKDHIQVSSRSLYKDLKRTGVPLGNSGKLVAFTKEGWDHITRQSRSRLTQIQSLILLGSLRKILAATSESELKSEQKPRHLKSLVHISAAVSFPFRQAGIVKVVLWKRTNPNNNGVNYSFYTVYEPRRKRTVIGRRLL